VKILVVYREIPEERLARLRTIADGHKVIGVQFPRGGDRTPPPELMANLVDAHILFGAFAPPNLLDLAPNLRWLQFPQSGVERLVNPLWAESKLAVTNTAGVSSDGIAEYALGGMIWFAKGLPEFEISRREHRYERRRTATLAGRTCGVVGLGAIGRDIARLARAFEMRVIATRRHLPAALPENVDQIYPREALHDLLGASDYVAVSVALTEETRDFIGAPELAAMKPSAVLINVARGGVVDEPALIAALQEKRIRGAVLDVFAQEPLPSDSPLWDLDNVLMTPHTSGDIEGYLDRVYDIFEDNLRRFLAGEPLRNVVHPELGY
jgi:phosphoglycerate dehydrogenase-like enzyme